MADKRTIRAWLKLAPHHASHMIVVHDKANKEDFPVYVVNNNPQQMVRVRDGVNNQKVTEVYNLSLDLEKQLSEDRALHF